MEPLWKVGHDPHQFWMGYYVYRYVNGEYQSLRNRRGRTRRWHHKTSAEEATRIANEQVKERNHMNEQRIPPAPDSTPSGPGEIPQINAVVARMVCNGKLRTEGNAPNQVNMAAVHDGSPENERFFSATPWGTVALGILNEQAYGYFREGATYEVTFREVAALNTPIASA